MEINEDIQLIIKDNLNHNDNFIDLIEKKNVDEILNIICITLNSICDNIDTVIKGNIRNEIINNLLQKKELTVDTTTNICKMFPLHNVTKTAEKIIKKKKLKKIKY
jgi:hypothetical protein